MNTRIRTLGWVALGAWLALPMLGDAANGQGPVREGVRNVAEGTAEAVRRTGEATRNVVGGVAEGTAKAARRTGEAARNVAEGVAEGTAKAVRRTGEATRNVIGGVAEGTANAARRTGEAARNLGQGARETLRAATPPYRGEYGAGYRGAPQADGVVGQPQPGNEGQYLGQQQYQSEYQQGAQPMTREQGDWGSAGTVYQLRHDSCGREFICVGGQRVYFTSQAAYQDAQPVMAEPQREQAEDHSAPAAPSGEPLVADAAAQGDSPTSPAEADTSQPEENQGETAVDVDSDNSQDEVRNESVDENADANG